MLADKNKNAEKFGLWVLADVYLLLILFSCVVWSKEKG